MKNPQIFAMLVVGSLIVLGCSTSNPNATDVRLVATDAAAKTDILIDTSGIKDGSSANFETRPEARPETGPDAGPELGEETGSETIPDVQDAFMPDRPCINPLPGHYSATLDPALSKTGDSIGRFGSYGFTVSPDKDGAFWVESMHDGYTRYKFSMACGLLNFIHGDGFEGRGGTNCPTDGFAFVGSFVSPTEARGQYKDLSWRCQIGASGYFIATLDPQPDSGTVINTMPLDAGTQAVDASRIDATALDR